MLCTRTGSTVYMERVTVPGASRRWNSGARAVRPPRVRYQLLDVRRGRDKSPDAGTHRLVRADAVHSRRRTGHRTDATPSRCSSVTTRSEPDQAAASTTTVAPPRTAQPRVENVPESGAVSPVDPGGSTWTPTSALHCLR